MRIMTEKDLLKLTGVNKSDLPPPTEEEKARGAITLPERVLPETAVPEYRKEQEGVTAASPELLMKLGALQEEAKGFNEGEEDELIVNGKGQMSTNEAIGLAAARAAAANSTPGVLPGSLVQTDKGPMFQAAPTNVTIVPPAKSIQVVGGPEAVEADEDLASGRPVVNAATVIPTVLPGQAQPQAGGAYISTPPFGTPQTYGIPQAPIGGVPMYGMPQGYGQGQFYPPQMGGALNMGSFPAVYSTPAPPVAQLYSSGVPGAPPTFAVPTDDLSMQQFGGGSMGPKASRAGLATRKNRVSFGGSSDSAQSGSGPSVQVFVTKGN